MFQIIVLLSIRRGNRNINRVLALLIGLLTFSLWNFYTYRVGLPAYWRLFNYESWYAAFLWGPTLYFYIGMICGQLQFNLGLFLRHYSLGIALFAIGSIMHLMNPQQLYVDSFKHIKLLMFYVQMSLYFLLCFQCIKTYNRRIRDHFAAIDKMSLSWLQRLLSIFAMLIAVDMGITVPAVLSQAARIPYVEIYQLAEAVAIFAIGYFSLLYAESLFYEVRKKYENSPLDNQLSTDLVAKLKTIMQDSEPYKNNELKLDDLAQLVGISPHYLSQIINEQCQKNFYDFINQYRARAAAELLLTNKSFSITQVAYTVGFNNRTSFNSAFKKYIGMTPSQYRLKQSAADDMLKQSV